VTLALALALALARRLATSIGSLPWEEAASALAATSSPYPPSAEL